MARPGAWIGVVGPGSAVPAPLLEVAEEVGVAVAEAGAALVCGGLGGVMEAACRGARSRGGLTAGLLPGLDRDDANGWVAVPIPTGLGEARNALVVRAADALVAVGGGWGTLSEIALALKAGKPVVGVETWTLTPPPSTRALSGVAAPPHAAGSRRRGAPLGEGGAPPGPGPPASRGAARAAPDPSLRGVVPAADARAAVAEALQLARFHR